MDLDLSKKLKDHHWPKAGIENKLGMPKNSLAGMINGTRPTPKKWEEKLRQFVLDTEIKADQKTPEAMFEKMQETFKNAPEYIPPIGSDLNPDTYLSIPTKTFADPEGKPIPMAEPRKWNDAPWVKKIEDYCGLAGITPEELIEQHAMKGAIKTKLPATKAIIEDSKKVIVNDLNEQSKPKGGYNPYSNPRFKKLHGDKAD